MRRIIKTMLKVLFVIPFCFGGMIPLSDAQTVQGTSFTYQGRLVDAGSPASGLYDFGFSLFDGPDPAVANQIGGTLNLFDVSVTDGLFTVELDFGPVFDGDARWLEIQVAPAGTLPLTQLLPTQLLNSVPYALKALDADDADADPTNELQTLSWDSGTNNLGISSGNTVNLGSLVDDNDWAYISGSGLTGSLYRTGNVGIGITNPESALHVQDTTEGVLKVGSATANGNGTIIFEEGSTDAMAIRYDGASNVLKIDDETTATTRMLINRSTGYVGIGTTQPVRHLHLHASNSPEIRITNDNTGQTSLDGSFMGINSVGNAFLWNREDQNLYFGTNSTNRMVIDNTGNVGIGTTIPDERMVVKMGGTSWSSPHFALEASGSTNKWDFLMGGTLDKLYIGYNESSKMVVDTDGNVGIGTTSPISKVSVVGETSQDVDLDITTFGLNQKATLKLCEGEGCDYGMYWQYDGTDNKMKLYGDESGTMYGPHITVNRQSGNVGIGTDTPNEKFVVKMGGTTWADPHFVLEASGSSNKWDFTVGGSDRLFIGYNESSKMMVDTNGNVGIGTFSPNNKLDVLGTIRAEEIVVETGWADYVFQGDYVPMDLDQVEKHIQQKGHLPGIPTEAQVKENGIALGAFQAKMLEKIEELTLYIIDQNKEIDALKKEIAQLNAQVAGVNILQETH